MCWCCIDFYKTENTFRMFLLSGSVCLFCHCCCCCFGGGGCSAEEDPRTYSALGTPAPLPHWPADVSQLLSFLCEPNKIVRLNSIEQILIRTTKTFTHSHHTDCNQDAAAAITDTEIQMWKKAFHYASCTLSAVSLFIYMETQGLMHGLLFLWAYILTLNTSFPSSIFCFLRLPTSGSAPAAWSYPHWPSANKVKTEISYTWTDNLN